MCKPSKPHMDENATRLTSDDLQQEYVLTEADSPRAPEPAVTESRGETDGGHYGNSTDLPQPFVSTSGMRDNRLPN